MITEHTSDGPVTHVIERGHDDGRAQRIAQLHGWPHRAPPRAPVTHRTL